MKKIDSSGDIARPKPPESPIHPIINNDIIKSKAVISNNANNCSNSNKNIESSQSNKIINEQWLPKEAFIRHPDNSGSGSGPVQGTILILHFQNLYKI